MTMRTPILAFCLAAAALLAAAEKADREKEVNVGADKLTADDRNKLSTFEGNVIVTQGTMRITAATVAVKEDPQRFKFYVATGAPVTFRQKRDKSEDYIEGSAERAEFDDRSDMLKLVRGARLKSSQGEITGDLITYDMGRELFQVTSAGSTTTSPASRVKATLIPQKKAPAGAKAPEPPAPAPPLQLKPDPGPAQAQ